MWMQLLASGLLISGCRGGASVGDTSSSDGAPMRSPPSALRVMSFNLRYDNPGDGVNAWPNRKDWVASLIRFYDTDIVGVQEALASMLVDLDSRLPGVSRVGVGRTDGRAAGESSAILYRADRLTLLDSGTFWLSPTPEVVGSKGWDAAIERVATWARFRDRRSGCRFLHINTHFDHIGEQARIGSARLIRRRAASLAMGLPVVMTGDLNSDPRSTAYRVLTRDTVANALPPVVVYLHGVVADSRDGRFPSDHFPVLASVAPCGE